MDQQELLRYSRHFLLPEIGPAGQEKLKAAKVLVIGAGGLGSPLSLYLAAAGVGHLSILDFDTVDLSNLQRQVLYSTAQVGRSKADCASERLSALNPQIEINALNEKLTKENAARLFSRHDVIADGADNFATRYLSNDAAVLTKKPLVSASILGFEGQLSVFNHKGGPCYRCLYSEPPPAGQVPSCSENGVLGVLPGIMGCLQASEVLKLILGIGETLHGHLLYFDALRMDFQKMQTMRNKECAVCGEKPTILELKDTMPDNNTSSAIPEMTVKELEPLLKQGKVQLIDIREAHELQHCKIPGALHIPMGELEDRLNELDRSKTIVLQCRSGSRSGRMAYLLKEAHGIETVNLAGGVLAWVDQIDPSQKKY